MRGLVCFGIDKSRLLNSVDAAHMIIVSVEQKLSAEIKSADAEISSDFWLMRGPLPQCSRPPVKVGLIATKIGFHVCLQRLSNNQLCCISRGSTFFCSIQTWTLVSA